MSTIKGTIHWVGETEQVSDKFRKREFVIKTIEQYPQSILIQATQDKCDIIPIVGTEVEAHCNIRGREWINPQGETKYFNSIELWKF